MHPEHPLLLRPREVARLLSISRSRVYDLCRSGELPVTRIGRSVRVHRDHLEKWLESQSTARGEVKTW